MVLRGTGESFYKGPEVGKSNRGLTIKGVSSPLISGKGVKKTAGMRKLSLTEGKGKKNATSPVSIRRGTKGGEPEAFWKFDAGTTRSLD